MNCTYLCYSPSSETRENDYKQPLPKERNEEYLLNLKHKGEKDRHYSNNEHVKCYFGQWNFIENAYGGLFEITDQDNIKSSQQIIDENTKERKEILSKKRKQSECPFVRYKSSNPRYQGLDGNLKIVEYRLSRKEEIKTRIIVVVSLLCNIALVLINLFSNPK